MANGTKEFKEITLKFGEGYVKGEFQARDGNQYKEIMVPNQDKGDRRPWQTFVARANQVHENQFGKGVWMKLPAEGYTTLKRSVVVGENPDGTRKYGSEQNKVANTELKKMMEGYKKERPRESVTSKLEEKKAEVASQKAAEKTQEKDKSREVVL